MTLCAYAITAGAQPFLVSDSLKLQRWFHGGEEQINMPLFQTKYTADPSPLVVGDTLFLYTSHTLSHFLHDRLLSVLMAELRSASP